MASTGGIANGPGSDIPAAISLLKGFGKIPAECEFWEWVDQSKGVFRAVGCETLWQYTVDSDTFTYGVEVFAPGG